VILSRAIAHDDHGNEIVRGELLAVAPKSADLAIARRLHFIIVHKDHLSALGLLSVTLAVPKGMTAVTALALLRHADPAGDFDYSTIYNPSGDGQAPVISMPQSASLPATNIVLGMIDGGIDRLHPSLTGARISVRSFAGNGTSLPTPHGTAIASLLVGKGREFSGYLPGASLYAADVYGGAADGGSAADITRALNWLAGKGVAVTNISLSGPPNALLSAAVRAFIGTGHVLVAAAGNNGPAAPPNYPAGYPGVICVTSVDTERHFEIDANLNRCRFAAVGVDVRAARLPQGYALFTGTSYAAPLVTARFARLIPNPSVRQDHKVRHILLRAAQPITGVNGHAFYLIRVGHAQKRTRLN
jgi:subtilisin family serine protease